MCIAAYNSTMFQGAHSSDHALQPFSRIEYTNSLHNPNHQLHQVRASVAHGAVHLLSQAISGVGVLIHSQTAHRSDVYGLEDLCVDDKDDDWEHSLTGTVPCV